MSRIRRLRNDGGFSLLEVAVGLVVFAMMLLTVTMVFALGSRLSTQASLRDQATSVAEGHLEELRSRGKDWLIENHTIEEKVENKNGTFDISTSVEPYATDILRVTVNVHWTDRGEPVCLTIESLIGEN